MLRLLVCFSLVVALQPQSAPPVLPAIADPQSDFAPGVPRQGTPGLKLPKLIKSVDPNYTSDAMRAGVAGTAILDAVIGVDGLIEASRVRCSLYPSLDAQAQKALAGWRFEPALLNGAPTRLVVEVQMEFRLDRKGDLPAVTQPCRAVVGSAGPAVMAQASQKVAAQIIPPDQEDEFLKGAVSSKVPGVVAPKPLRQVEPKYTVDALRARVQGNVKLEAIVGVDGKVEKSRVKESLHLDLDAEALRTLNQWQFEPGRVNGQPARVLVEVLMTFRVR